MLSVVAPCGRTILWPQLLQQTSPHGQSDGDVAQQSLSHGSSQLSIQLRLPPDSKEGSEEEVAVAVAVAVPDARLAMARKTVVDARLALKKSLANYYKM